MQVIKQKIKSDTMYYLNIPVLKYHIQYPFFLTNCNQKTAAFINAYYSSFARQQEEYCRTMLYSQAVEAARFIQRNDPPFPSFEFDMNYQITFNYDCITSLYIDRYTYTGGAHGSTVRSSDTWNFAAGKRIALKDFYLHNPLYQQKIHQQIELQISEILKESPAAFFDNYEKLLRDAFHPENYYLKPGYIVIYYQQYDIAPYASGIPEFYLPHSL